MRQILVLAVVIILSLAGRLGADEKSPKAKDAEAERIDRMVQTMLDRFDANKDGKISKEEAKGKLAENFDKLDVNKDGFLDKEELRRAARFVLANMGKGDNAKPGVSSNPSVNQTTTKDFDALDRNADGRLSRQEVKGTEFADHFDEIDINKDGTIDRKEFRAYLKKKAEKVEEKPTKK
jgi:Ca2+-binding EF-hand superfamily protein